MESTNPRRHPRIAIRSLSTGAFDPSLVKLRGLGPISHGGLRREACASQRLRGRHRALRGCVLRVIRRRGRPGCRTDSSRRADAGRTCGRSRSASRAARDGGNRTRRREHGKTLRVPSLLGARPQLQIPPTPARRQRGQVRLRGRLGVERPHRGQAGRRRRGVPRARVVAGSRHALQLAPCLRLHHRRIPSSLSDPVQVRPRRHRRFALLQRLLPLAPRRAVCRHAQARPVRRADVARDTDRQHVPDLPGVRLAGRGVLPGLEGGRPDLGPCIQRTGDVGARLLHGRAEGGRRRYEHHRHSSHRSCHLCWRFSHGRPTTRSFTSV